MKKDKYRTIRVTVDIDYDGDIYVLGADKKRFHYLGTIIGDDTEVITMDNKIISVPVPSPAYLKARRIAKK